MKIDSIKSLSLSAIWLERDHAGCTMDKKYYIICTESERREFERALGHAITTTEIKTLLSALLQGKIKVTSHG